MHTAKLVLSAAAIAALAGCGSSKPSAQVPPSSSAAAGSAPVSSSSSSSTPAGVLAPDATSAATGDIPDNQVFLVYTNTAAGYSLEYPEGWTQSGSGADVTFRDKNNLVHVIIAHAARPTTASVGAALVALRRSNPTLTFHAPQAVVLGAAHAIKAVYRTRSAPNPVTGRRVTLIVDRYELGRAGRVAVVDLGTPTGVDNVDAYRKMIASFRWR
ncbi:MAG TPA: PsbP-related protein [Solirubrobacteraceae bacterium]|jgi:hypothetical protein